MSCTCDKIAGEKKTIKAARAEVVDAPPTITVLQHTANDLNLDEAAGAFDDHLCQFVAA